MAISYATDTDQPEEATTEVARPRGRPVRERFNDLPARVRDEILDKYRDINTGHDWWDGVYDLFKTDMEEIGIEVDRMYFSGFWSQGDGACFEGMVRDWPEFLTSLGYTCPALLDHAAAQFRFYVTHRGHHYHENCTHFNVDLPLPEHDEDQYFIDGYCPHEPGSLHEATWMVLINGYTHSSLEEQFIEAFKNHMRELYNRLETEYDDLTSDETVLESLEANDLLEDAITDATENDYA
jgi:arginyl-tRNA synthetase